MRHSQISKRCDGCHKMFRFANKYVSHRHAQEPGHKKASKERFDAVRGDVKAALDRASGSRKRRKDLPSLGQQKKHKPALSGDPPIDAPKSPLYVPDKTRPLGAASFDLTADSDQPGGLFGVDESLSLFHQATVEATAAPFVLSADSGRPSGSTGVDDDSQSYHLATNYLHDMRGSTQQAMPSEPPSLWEMAIWNTNWDSVNSQATF
ncbi:hypothetical protein TOPH_09194 [Tolypocladium ophioglossoides CBS 100239]|uniref:Uncharacterized protein n=1 Tax=Tolypocladium ophioglossoides (strain CBS 100239) TaxID=1163406 RepID=A0A0L0MWL4_TOLOC|nr:hypothetical protein TOPH_09194 [Tolypocladium ophioglossoides CBS 100239]